MSADFIAAIIPFNGESVDDLLNAVTSVEAQTVKCGKIYIVDNSLHSLASKQDWSTINMPLEVIVTTPNLGAAAARNIGILAAIHFEYLAFLDSDDIWMPEKLEKQLQFMQKYMLESSTTNFSLVKGEESRSRPLGVRKTKPPSSYLRCHLGMGSTLIIKRALLLELECFDKKLFRFEDWDLVIRLEQRNHIIRILKVALSVVHRIPSKNWNLASEALNLLKAKHRQRSIQNQIELQSGIFLERSVILFRNHHYFRGLVNLVFSGVMSYKNGLYILLLLKERLSNKT